MIRVKINPQTGQRNLPGPVLLYSANLRDKDSAAKIRSKHAFKIKSFGMKEGKKGQGLLGGPEEEHGEDRGEEGVHPQGCQHLKEPPDMKVL